MPIEGGRRLTRLLALAVSNGSIFIIELAIDRSLLPKLWPPFRIAAIVGLGLFNMTSLDIPLISVAAGAPFIYASRERIFFASGGTHVLSTIVIFCEMITVPLMDLITNRSWGQEGEETRLRRVPAMAGIPVHLACAFMIPRALFVWDFITGASGRSSAWFWVTLLFAQVWALCELAGPTMKQNFPFTYGLSIYLTQVCLVKTAATSRKRAMRILYCLLFRLCYRNIKKFEYQSLDEQQGQIRLLKLFPSAFPSIIRASLVTVPVNERTHYEAVSYRWSNEHYFPLVIDDQTFSVSETVYIMLAHLRGRKSDRVLWIDAICINQSDSSEKEWQISLMGQIYRGADRVLGWLGNNVLLHGALSTLSLDSQDLTEDLRTTVTSGTFSTRWFAVMDILRNEWFSRIWIIQEVAFANNMVLLHGQDTMGWDDFSTIISQLLHSGKIPSLLHCLRFSREAVVAIDQSMGNIVRMDNIRHELSANAEGIELQGLMEESKKFSSSDPHDRIFGILGLSTADAKTSISINYDIEIEDLTFRVGRFCLFTEMSLVCLELAGTGHERVNSDSAHKEKPSWMLDWTSLEVNRLSTRVGPVGLYEASTHFPTLIEEVHGCPYLIGLSTCVFDTIRQLSPVWEREILTPRPYKYTQRNESLKSATALATLVRKGLEMVTIAADALPELYDEKPNAILRRMIFAKERKRDGTVDFIEDEDSRETLIEEFYRHISDPDIEGPKWMRFVRMYSRLLGLIRYTIGRRLCLTSSGYFGLVPAYTKPGDLVCLISGAQTPFVVRPLLHVHRPFQFQGIGPSYQLVGSCLIDGIMHGELNATNIGFQRMILE